MVVQAFSLSIEEAGAGGSLRSGPDWSTDRVPRQDYTEKTCPPQTNQ